MRIVSLLGSATDLVVALGAAHELCGRSHECDAPEVAHLPVLSRPTFDVSGSSADIDARVRAKLRAGEPLYQVDEVTLAALAPDVVLSQTHCEVCSVAPGDLGSPRCARLPVVSFTGGSLAGVLGDFAAVARVIGRQGEAARLAATLEAELATVRARVAGRQRPRVLMLEWIEPAFTMGNWGPELVAAAGGEALLATAGAPSRVVGWDEIRAVDPDVLVVAPCGWDLERAAGELPTLAAKPGFHDLRAVRAGRCWVADGNRFFNRSSPDLFRTPALLAGMLHFDDVPNDFCRRLVERREEAKAPHITS